MTIHSCPSAYTDGYTKARLHNQELTNRYIKHTTMGDPELDPLMKELSSLPIEKLHKYIGAGIEQDEVAFREAPQDLHNFFNKLNTPPPWLNHKTFESGVRAFHANVDLMLVAFVTGVLVEGFSTLIAKSFNITGRVASTKRRLQQNNRHMIDIFFPNGLERNGDGWKLSTRIRFIHSRIRGLLDESEEWNHDAWGTPVSAAHLGFAISVFSKRLLEYSMAVGAKFNKDEQESVLAVWRYAGYLMGIPETILYTTSAEAEEMYKIGYICEPLPDSDSIAVANTLIKAIPAVADITDPEEQKYLTHLAYTLSRALIGNKLANQFQFPKTRVFGILFTYRMKQFLQRKLKGQQLIRSENFSNLIQISVYDKHGLSYKMPNHVHTDKSIEW